ILSGVFTRGRAPWKYLSALSAHLFLSAHEEDVHAALSAGVPAARLIPWSKPANESHPNEIRIAFDGDAVLFSDEAEKIYQEHGKEVFVEHEIAHAKNPLLPGPLKPLLFSLHQLQKSHGCNVQIRTALITARSTQAHERAMNTLIGWNIEIDEAMFLGGLNKSRFLREFEADIFFDDQLGHIQSAALQVPSAQVINR
ncbi:MAG: 5'-nucleotidase, partial [Gammaproteobacteria bacterium]|nr:5'-nucleotidase [Gammaproteobacteria bacterium]